MDENIDIILDDKKNNQKFVSNAKGKISIFKDPPKCGPKGISNARLKGYLEKKRRIKSYLVVKGLLTTLFAMLDLFLTVLAIVSDEAGYIGPPVSGDAELLPDSAPNNFFTYDPPLPSLQYPPFVSFKKHENPYRAYSSRCRSSPLFSLHEMASAEACLSSTDHSQLFNALQHDLSKLTPDVETETLSSFGKSIWYSIALLNLCVCWIICLLITNGIFLLTVCITNFCCKR
ncbi:hypothetical protein IEQ34_016343 [Dendrobium chrysotoxum]|uniref:Uncharacterized protein n=1 Tax=Dendrobium chrysotoxum TaxID=161865 RepID=A0AAV7GEU0_DENCH|nr:hypothetical protein IEQ34_016343 [Dendrobium chrysotoxum]